MGNIIGLFISGLFWPGLVWGNADYVRGFNLTEIGSFRYDAQDAGAKTEAQNRVDALYDLGVRQINLVPRAIMRNPRGVELIPITTPSERPEERRRYLRLMSYVHSKGMKVGVRPIFLVVDAQGNTPYIETLPNGEKWIWWHGNIQPGDPNAWFESYKTYLDIYMNIAKLGKADEFTLGAELYSMTVGIEDQWLAHPHGFPGRWLALLTYLKGHLPQAALMYDINFTDDKIQAGSLTEFGGELARWRYRIVDLANPQNESENLIWRDLVNFWSKLDGIGIDVYRSLATKQQAIPTDYSALVEMLTDTASRYASQIDNAIVQIESITGKSTPVWFKEVGYRSVEKGFIDPFTYSGTGKLDVSHQAAAYEAIFRAFWEPGWEWFNGFVFWDASVAPALHGGSDIGFSPLGKSATEGVIRRYFE